MTTRSLGIRRFNGPPSPAELDKSFCLMMPTGSAGAVAMGTAWSPNLESLRRCP